MPPPPPCSAPVPLTPTTRLSQLAVQHSASISQMQLSSGITPATPADGRASVSVGCPAGVWSEPFGKMEGNPYNDGAAKPFVGICLPGSYVIQFAITTGTLYDDVRGPSYTYLFIIVCRWAGGCGRCSHAYHAAAVASRSRREPSRREPSRARPRRVGGGAGGESIS